MAGDGRGGRRGPAEVAAVAAAGAPPPPPAGPGDFDVGGPCPGLRFRFLAARKGGSASGGSGGYWRLDSGCRSYGGGCKTVGG